MKTGTGLKIVAVLGTVVPMAWNFPGIARGYQWEPRKTFVQPPPASGFGQASSSRYRQPLNPIADPNDAPTNPDGSARLLNFVVPQPSADVPTGPNSFADSRRPPNASGSSALVWTHPASARLQEPQDEKLQPPESLDEALNDPTNRERFQTVGGTELIEQRYPDGKIQLTREMIQDDEGNYINHGWWKLYNQAGQIIADGIFNQGYMEGPWKRLHLAQEGGLFTSPPFNLFQGPFTSMATFEHGQLTGVWQIIDRNQRKIMEVTYREGKRHGPANWWFPNGSKFREMMFHDGLLDGKLMEWDATRKIVREEEYIEGRLVNTQTEQYSVDHKKSAMQILEAKLVPEGQDDWWSAKPTGYQSEGESVRQGPYTSWFENGQMEMKGQHDQGERQGPFIWWHKNGQKQLVGEYDHGGRVGKWTWWHPNGMKFAEGHYEADKAVGTWLRWDEAGKVVDSQNFSNDALPNPTQSEDIQPATESGDAPQPEPKPLSTDPKIEKSGSENSEPPRPENNRTEQPKLKDGDPAINPKLDVPDQDAKGTGVTETLSPPPLTVPHLVPSHFRVKPSEEIAPTETLPKPLINVDPEKLKTEPEDILDELLKGLGDGT